MGELIIAGLGTLVPASLGTLAVPWWLTAGANLLGSALLSTAAARMGRRKPGEVAEDIRLPRSLPPVRWAWGIGARVPGTAVYLGDRSGFRYLAYLVASHPSDTTGFALRLDGRDITLSGDPTNFGPLTRGAVTVPEGETQVVITHGLGTTPARAGAYADGLVTAIDAVGATTFRATLADPAPEGGQELNWVAYADAAGATALIPGNLVGQLEVWLQDGTQTHPPTRLLIENGDPFSGQGGPLFGSEATANPLWHTDKHHGLTVVWIKMRLGAANTRQSRWPAPVPVLDCAMAWQRIYNPLMDSTRGGEGPQRINDPATWEPTSNQAACLLHLARFNPVYPWQPDQLLLDSFVFGAEVADEDVPLKAGGTVKRYEVGGFQTFAEKEMPGLLAEMADAGGGELFTVGGRLGYRPGSWIEPALTMPAHLRGSVKYAADRDRTSTPQAVRVVYRDPGADWEDATFEPVAVTPAWGGDERRVLTWTQPLVSNPYQAMRLQQMKARELALGGSLSAEYPPNPAADLMCGAVVEIADAGAPYRDGVYRVVEKDGVFSIADGGEGAAFRVKLGFRQDAEFVTAWNPETDELPYEAAVPNVIDRELPLPFDLDGGFDFDGFGQDRLRVVFSVPGGFTPGGPEGEPSIRSKPAHRVLRVGTAGQFGRDDPGGADHQLFRNRRRCCARGSGRAATSCGSGRSAAARSVTWVYGGPYLLGVDLDAPTAVSASPGAGQITINATSPDGDHAALEYWGSDVDDPWSATLLATQTVAVSTADSFTETGLSAGATRFYFVRSVALTGAVGPWSDSVTATAT
jgi:hypothetical protein